MNNYIDYRDYRDYRGRTSFMIACSNNKHFFALNLLNSGIDIHLKCNLNKTALMYAISSNNYCLIIKLIENGIDINCRDKYGRTALIYALLSKKYDNHFIIDYLLKYNADNDLTKCNKHVFKYKLDDKSLCTLFKYFFTSNNKNYIKNIIKYKFSSFNFNELLKSLVFENNNYNIYEILLLLHDLGVNISTYTNIISLAILNDNIYIVDLLIDYGVKIIQSDINNSSKKMIKLINYKCYIRPFLIDRIKRKINLNRPYLSIDLIKKLNTFF